MRERIHKSNFAADGWMVGQIEMSAETRVSERAGSSG